MSKHLLRVLNLGKRSYADVLRTQDILRQRVILQSGAVGSFPAPSDFTSPTLIDTLHKENYPGEPENFLLLVEHWPVFTAGIRDKAFTEKDAARLKVLGADVCRTSRGGLATYHGPGQLVAYPILNLKTHGIGVKAYNDKLEQTLMETCESLGVTTRADRGIWVEDRKIASIGFSVKRHVTYHGVALNCSTDLKWFDHIRPCGLNDVQMTSLSKETGGPISVSETVRHFLHSFSNNFHTCVSSVSDYVPAAISCSKEEPINARVF